ncbi:MAG: hypothetical protein IJ170_07180 [Ruminococcus sp.]|nr:hypothetical protein [Ruminococcus sp.]
MKISQMTKSHSLYLVVLVKFKAYFVTVWSGSRAVAHAPPEKTAVLLKVIKISAEQNTPFGA